MDGSQRFFVLGEGDANYVARRGEAGVALLRTIENPKDRSANTLIARFSCRGKTDEAAKPTQGHPRFASRLPVESGCTERAALVSPLRLVCPIFPNCCRCADPKSLPKLRRGFTGKPMS